MTVGFRTGGRRGAGRFIVEIDYSINFLTSESSRVNNSGWPVSVSCDYDDIRDTEIGE